MAAGSQVAVWERRHSEWLLIKSVPERDLALRVAGRDAEEGVAAEAQVDLFEGWSALTGPAETDAAQLDHGVVRRGADRSAGFAGQLS